MYPTNTVHQESLSEGYGKKQEYMSMIKKWGWSSSPWMKFLIYNWEKSKQTTMKLSHETKFMVL